MAYKAADLAGYALSHQMEKLCDNPHQSNGLEGIVVVNASDSVQTTEVTYPESYGEDFRQLSALRSKSYVPYLNNSEEMLSGELLTLQPFSYRVLPFEELKERKKESDDKAQAYSVENDGIKTPYYEVGIDEKGGIRRLTTLLPVMWWLILTLMALRDMVRLSPVPFLATGAERYSRM